MTDDMHPVVAEIETASQARQLCEAVALVTLAYQILAAPPVWREHWWQFWRDPKPARRD